MFSSVKTAVDRPYSAPMSAVYAPGTHNSPLTTLIAVSVAVETARTLESQMLMRHYKGFLK